MCNDWKSNSFLTSIIENIPTMVFVKDAKDLRFVWFNKAGEQWFGLSHKDLIGKSDFDFFPKDQAKLLIDNDREVLKSKTLRDIPEEAIDTPRGRRLLHTKKIPLLDEAGIPRYLLGISEDITDIKTIREEIRHVRRMEAVRPMAAGVVHEFNNIHQAILMAAGFIKTAPSADETSRSCAEEILKSVQRAGALTNRLGVFAEWDCSAQPAQDDQTIRPSAK